MRRASLFLILTIVALALVLGAAACGGSTSGAPASGTQTPEQILGSAVAASGGLTSATGSLDVSITLDLDTSQMPEEMTAIFAKPITLKGTFASGADPQAADLDMTVGLGGESLNLAFKSDGIGFWARLNDQWYEMPVEMMQGMGQDEQMQAKMAEIGKLVTDLGVDPVTWMKNVTVVGEEKLDGVGTYHLKGTPDVAKMLADFIGLMQSEEFTNLMNEAMASADSVGLGSMMPSPDELQEVQNIIAQVFKGFTVELWLGQEDSLPRKVVVDAQIVPPPGEETDGLNGIVIAATISLENVNKPVSVKAPDSPLPFTELEKAMQENPDQFLGPLAPMLQGLGTGMGM